MAIDLILSVEGSLHIHIFHIPMAQIEINFVDKAREPIKARPTKFYETEIICLENRFQIGLWNNM